MEQAAKSTTRNTAQNSHKGVNINLQKQSQRMLKASTLDIAKHTKIQYL